MTGRCDPSEPQEVPGACLAQRGRGLRAGGAACVEAQRRQRAWSKGRVEGDVSEVSRGQVMCSFWILFHQPWEATEGCPIPLATVFGVERRGPEQWASIRRLACCPGGRGPCPELGWRWPAGSKAAWELDEEPDVGGKRGTLPERSPPSGLGVRGLCPQGEAGG